MVGTANALNINQQGTVYFDGVSVFTGVDGGTAGHVLTSNGTGIAPAFKVSATSGTVTDVTGTVNQVAVATGTTTPVISLIGPYTPATYTAHGLLVGEGTSSIASLATGTAGQIVQSGGASADPTYSTSTYPSTNAVNTLLYASSANVMAALPTANNGVLVTSNTGVPSLLANSSTPGYVLTANSGSPPSWQSSGSGSGIVTIDGDTGSITGSTVKIYADNAGLTSGSTVKFINSGTTSTLYVSDPGLGNTNIGAGAGNLSNTGGTNTSLGVNTLVANSSGYQNVAIGASAFNQLTSGNANTAIGTGAGGALLTGSNNVVIGDAAGGNWTGAESNNILIGTSITSVSGESNVTRIGGIFGGTPTGGSPSVVLCDGTNVLATITSDNLGYVLTSNGVTVAPSFQPASGGGFGSPTYFQAYLSSPQSITAGVSNVKVVFDSVTTNVGSAYNPSTGVFTAPTTGFYGFSATLPLDGVTATTGKTNNGYIGSVQSVRMITYGPECFATTNELVIDFSWQQPMTAGDTMYIFSESGGSGTYLVYGASLSSVNYTALFSGYRIA